MYFEEIAVLTHVTREVIVAIRLYEDVELLTKIKLYSFSVTLISLVISYVVRCKNISHHCKIINIITFLTMLIINYGTCTLRGFL